MKHYILSSSKVSEFLFHMREMGSLNNAATPHFQVLETWQLNSWKPTEITASNETV